MTCIGMHTWSLQAAAASARSRTGAAVQQVQVQAAFKLHSLGVGSLIVRGSRAVDIGKHITVKGKAGAAALLALNSKRGALAVGSLKHEDMRSSRGSTAQASTATSHI